MIEVYEIVIVGFWLLFVCILGGLSEIIEDFFSED